MLLSLAAAGWIIAPLPTFAAVQTAQFNPLRGAAGGALIGAISGNAGRDAAIGAGVGGVAGAARRGSARRSGGCY